MHCILISELCDVNVADSFNTDVLYTNFLRNMLISEKWAIIQMYSMLISEKCDVNVADSYNIDVLYSFFLRNMLISEKWATM